MAADSTYVAVHRRVVESGEWDRIYSTLLARLTESGWVDELRTSAASASGHGHGHSAANSLLAVPGAASSTGTPTTPIKDAIAAVSDNAQASVPLAVKQEILNVIRGYVAKQIE